MADEVEMIPVAGAEPPMADPLGRPAAEKPKTIKLAPVARPEASNGLRPGLKLPPRPGATGAFRPGLKLPPKPGATGAFRPGLKLPTAVGKPVIRKPGAVSAAPALPKPIEELKAVTQQLQDSTQRLKSITQAVPQQAVLHKTGIIAEGAVTAEQQEAIKHKTVRIALSEAMGVAPVKDDAAPMKTIRIKRPVNLPSTGTSSLKPIPKPAAEEAAPAVPVADAAKATTQSVGITQRRTLKIARPGVAARPGVKFGAPHRPASAAAKAPAGASASAGDAEVADLPNLPQTPLAPMKAAPVAKATGPVWIVSSIVQFAACVAMGVLLWFFYENSQLPTFCGGLGWTS